MKIKNNLYNQMKINGIKALLNLLMLKEKKI